MKRMMDRSCAEIVLFAAGAFGVWLSIWAVILVNKWLDLFAVGLTLCALIGFALRDTE
jgi:hypothetical protein